MTVGLFTRGIRPPPPDDIVPNPNDPLLVPPSTVGPDQLVVPGDPHGVTVEDIADPGWAPPRITPSAWSGWPADWWPPYWQGRFQALTDTAWECIDKNSGVFASLRPYLVGAAPSLNADWLTNPDPLVYGSWWDFARQLWWDLQAVGESFVIATARYATGFPARFHVVPPWLVEVELATDGLRRYTIGGQDVTDDIRHIGYQWTTADTHGHGPLEAAGARLVASSVLGQYAAGLATAGGIPASVLEHPEELTADQAADIRSQWVTARQSALGEPAILSGGIKWTPTQMNPKDMALVELQHFNESRIASILRIPPELVALPGAPDRSLTYNTLLMLLDQHWRVNLWPIVEKITLDLSGWLLPRGTKVEVNGDAYTQPDLLIRAQTYQIMAGIVDPVSGQQALTVGEIRAKERLGEATFAEGVPQ